MTSQDVARAIRSMQFYLSGSSYCPVCRTNNVGWKMVSPPICTDCGFTPFPKGEYRDIALNAADDINGWQPEWPWGNWSL